MCESFFFALFRDSELDTHKENIQKAVFMAIAFRVGRYITFAIYQ